MNCNLTNEERKTKKARCRSWDCSACNNFYTNCLNEEIIKLEKENEILKMQLAACAVAALSNTFEIIKLNRITKENPYWSGSYELVCDAVDREIALRLKLETTGT
jgi:hypothetical protein